MKLFFFGVGGSLNATGVILIGRYDSVWTAWVGCLCLGVALPVMIACR